MKTLLAVLAVLTLASCKKSEEAKPSSPSAAPVETSATAAPSAPAAAAPAKSPAELEKEKALAAPYPNDLGPAKIDEQIADYPADKKEGYRLLLTKCAQCHTAARPLHSRFVELEGKDAAVAKLKASEPGLFADPSIRQIEGAIWNRYVKRMMAKPGCAISPEEGKKIWQFLVYDGPRRKLGANAAAWEAHRKKLIGEFKAKHPQRYEELKKDNDL